MSGYHIVGDWGTSRLRIFRVENGEVVSRREGPGIGSLRTPPEQVLAEAILPWRIEGDPSSIRLCGMVGSRNGWIDVPYVDCPADAATWRQSAARLSLDGIPVEIMAGLATADAASPDVMRGEETQIFGAMARMPALASGHATIALPGTHSKWVSVEDGRITSFRTFLTGELYALLRDHSTLTKAATAETDDPAEQAKGFEEGLARASEGGHLLGSLFTARSMQLRAGRLHAWALGYLSGLIIGREVVEALTTFPTDRGVALVGDPKLSAHYERALALHNIPATIHDGDACALAGLALAETL